MVKKRKNNGRAKMNRGSSDVVNCENCRRVVQKDKAIRRFTVRNIIPNSAMRDVSNQSAYREYELPKVYRKSYFCISCAVHRKIVRARREEERKNREKPEPRNKPKIAREKKPQQEQQAPQN